MIPQNQNLAGKQSSSWPGVQINDTHLGKRRVRLLLDNLPANRRNGWRARHFLCRYCIHFLCCLFLSIGSDAAPLAWDQVAAWGTLLARLFVRRPQAAFHAVASAAAAEEGVAFLFSHPSLTVA